MSHGGGGCGWSEKSKKVSGITWVTLYTEKNGWRLNEAFFYFVIQEMGKNASGTKIDRLRLINFFWFEHVRTRLNMFDVRKEEIKEEMKEEELTLTSTFLWRSKDGMEKIIWRVPVSALRCSLVSVKSSIQKNAKEFQGCQVFNNC
jgi:hypothetical protein